MIGLRTCESGRERRNVSNSSLWRGISRGLWAALAHDGYDTFYATIWFFDPIGCVWRRTGFWPGLTLFRSRTISVFQDYWRLPFRRRIWYIMLYQIWQVRSKYYEVLTEMAMWRREIWTHGNGMLIYQTKLYKAFSYTSVVFFIFPRQLISIKLIESR